MSVWKPPAIVVDPLSTQNFEDLSKYLGDLPTRLTTIEFTAALIKHTRGASSLGFIASQFSNTVTITHGLGGTPTAVSVIADSGAGAFAVCTYKNLTATTFQIVGWSPGTSITATIPVTWVAFV